MKSLLLLFLFSAYLYGGSWILLDSDSLSVKAFIPSNTGEGFFIGTDQGMFHVSDWGGAMQPLPAFQNSSVPSMYYHNESNQFFAIISEGAESGLYLGNDVLDGAPYYDFTLIDSLRSPQQIGAVADTLIVISPDSLYRYALGEEVIRQSSVALPEFAFGVENPVCNAVLSVNETGILFGGYDRSPEPGEGGLYSYERGSVNKIFTGNVYSLEQSIAKDGRQFQHIGEDTVINCWNSTPPFEDNTKTSPNSAPVEDITFISNGIVPDGSMAVATRDGVFYEYGKSWKELGDLKEHVYSLYVSYTGFTGAPTLYAGTESGIYVYDENGTSTLHSSSRMNRKSAFSVSNRVLTLGSVPQSGRLVLYDIKGRIVHTQSFSAVKNLSLPGHLSMGIYSLLIKTGMGIETQMITIQ